MNHETLKDLVFTWHDGETTPSEGELAREHLALCPECRRELESWKDIAPLSFPSAAMPPSEDFVRGVMARVVGEPERQRGSGGLVRRLWEGFAISLRSRLVLAAAAGLVLMAVVLIPANRFRFTGRVDPVSSTSREFASDLLPLSDVEIDDGSGEIGTKIELYFL